jgi:hypothetical protein
MREIILVPFLNKRLAFFLLAYRYPLAISRLLMSFLTFHTAIFLSAIDSALMTSDVFGSRGMGRRVFIAKTWDRVSEKLIVFSAENQNRSFCRGRFFQPWL